MLKHALHEKAAISESAIKVAAQDCRMQGKHLQITDYCWYIPLDMIDTLEK